MMMTISHLFSFEDPLDAGVIHLYKHHDDVANDDDGDDELMMMTISNLFSFEDPLDAGVIHHYKHHDDVANDNDGDDDDDKQFI